MTHFQTFTKKLLSAMMAAALVVPAMATTSYAATPVAGTYDVDATLSCYVNAMGGVQFSDGYGLLKKTTVTFDESGNATATLSLGTTTGLSVYSVPCTAFIGTDEAPGYYNNGAVTKEGVTYTTSSDKVSNASGEVNYINSITMPVDNSISEYTLWMYLDSNVMGCQLGDGSGSGASNTPGVATKHTAKLTIDWGEYGEETSSVESDKVSGNAETQNFETTISYTYEAPAIEGPTYEVEIPKTLDFKTASNGSGSYKIALSKAVDFDAGEYVEVSAPTSGKLKFGEVETTYTHKLDASKLTKEGETISGKIDIATPPKSGTYTGTLTFTLTYKTAE